jgi:L-threonylcarbamoyladenylate synthase
MTNEGVIDERLIDEALAVLRRGGLVAMPTETVYGLAADAANEAAVRRIFAVKRRPADHPVIVHVADASHLPRWASHVPDTAAVLAHACWPGPLTLIVPRAAHVLDVVTGGRDTVGVRVPAHPVAFELLDRFGGGLAAPSANRFGMVSPTTARHVRADLGDDVHLVLEGGSSPIGVESTIVDCSVDPPQVLRPGAITATEIERLLGSELGTASGPSRASGMLASHYAPHADVLLAEARERAEQLSAEHPDALLIGIDVDSVDYARQLYGWLRQADSEHRATVIALLPPAEGLGHAIRDRLIKAAANSTG